LDFKTNQNQKILARSFTVQFSKIKKQTHQTQISRPVSPLTLTTINNEARLAI
jgi:hypothetical protein